MIRGFPPHVDRQTRLLVLGSLPGQISLARQEYYAHPRNQFWRLMGAVLGSDLAGLRYQDRLARLVEARVGLWDVIGAAVRPGSLDSAIRDVEANGLAALVDALPDLRAIGFNGAKAFALGCRLLPDAQVPLLQLPSSSPAHAAMDFAAKLQRWQALRDYV